MSTIDFNSDSRQAVTLHSSEKNLRPVTGVKTICLVALGLLGGCQKAPDAPPEPPQPDVAANSGCGSNGGLATELYGSIARPIRWSGSELRCESMSRPQGKGVRLRFTGSAAGNQLSFILALPELEPGRSDAESPTVVTLTVDGSGRFFSTPTLEACWSDITKQDRIADSDDRYDIEGTLYCVSPLGEINGDAAISVPEMAFRGIVDWSK